MKQFIGKHKQFHWLILLKNVQKNITFSRNKNIH